MDPEVEHRQTEVRGTEVLQLTRGPQVSLLREWQGAHPEDQAGYSQLLQACRMLHSQQDEDQGRSEAVRGGGDTHQHDLDLHQTIQICWICSILELII